MKDLREMMEWFAGEGFEVIVWDDNEGIWRYRRSAMNIDRLRKILDSIEEAVGVAEENEEDIAELGDKVIRLVNDAREELRKGEQT